MNIKKLFIITALSLQISTLTQAFSQDNYNNAFAAFYQAIVKPTGSVTYKQCASWVSQNQDKVADISQFATIEKSAGNTPEALAVGLYLAKGSYNSTGSKFVGADGLTKTGSSYTYSTTNITAAIAAAPDTVAVVTAPTQTVAATSDTNQTNWVNAFNAFGGASAVSAKTATVRTIPSSVSASAAYRKDALVVQQYLSTATAGDLSGVTNSADQTNLKNALSAAGFAVPVLATNNATATDKQNAGAALQAQIESAISLFNTYYGSAYYTSKPVIAATSLPA